MKVAIPSATAATHRFPIAYISHDRLTMKKITTSVLPRSSASQVGGAQAAMVIKTDENSGVREVVTVSHEIAPTAKTKSAI
jgi:hypothetical protein